MWAHTKKMTTRNLRTTSVTAVTMIRQGLPSRGNVPAGEAVNVLVWGELPEDVYALMHARGLEWDLQMHRYGRKST
jgi:hypothetical protein